MKIQAYARTDVGMKRKNNQDAFLKDDGQTLYVVADGMGGHQGGEVASRLAVETIQTFCASEPTRAPGEKLKEGIVLASRAIYERAASDPELNGMGTTVAALLFHEEAAYVAHVGDSRVYLLSEDGMWQITEDHSLLNEEIRAGRVLEGEEAQYQFRNVITRSVGYEPQVEVDVYWRKTVEGDIYLLCSDGLSGLVTAQEMSDAVRAQRPDQVLDYLVDLANERGGDDNITVLTCYVGK